MIKFLGFFRSQIEEIREEAIHSLSLIIKDKPGWIPVVLKSYYNTSNILERDSLAEVLNNHMDYLLTKPTGNDSDKIERVIKDIFESRKTNGIFGFLNRNKNIELENRILKIISPFCNNDSRTALLAKEFLTPRLNEKLGLKTIEYQPPVEGEIYEKKKKMILIGILSCLIVFFPLVYVVRRWGLLTVISPVEHIKQFIIDYNYYFIFYSVSLYTIYLLILFLSSIGIRKQYNYWRIKSPGFLFKDKLLPSISIIVPAYCEEKGIIENVNSLLNLHYPKFEVIVVNDGSPDNTFNKLVEYYSLEKVIYRVDEKLKTRPIKGIYVNNEVPNLVVVDKINGGKADALNAGINVAGNELICGIDADSLLERDSLLKATAAFVDNPEEIVAVGGNILPVNGCEVRKGELKSIHIPSNKTALLQLVEYLRAFMAGRIGWSTIKCFLIISGAFGLFRRDKVIEVGGYLTSSGIYHKDTVGEDMELVVRLSRHMREEKKPYRIHYSYNANCWTEVPEDLKILERQRNRWQRGLIDIMIFHKKLLFNPKYKTMGFISIPYFFIFEFIGPIFEILAYFMVALSAIIGILSVKAFLLIFISAILLSVVVSQMSILFTQFVFSSLSTKEILKLTIFALLENFGFRQLNSYWRLKAYISSIWGTRGWGMMIRKGIGGR